MLPARLLHINVFRQMFLSVDLNKNCPYYLCIANKYNFKSYIIISIPACLIVEISRDGQDRFVHLVHLPTDYLFNLFATNGLLPFIYLQQTDKH
jgi:hypothetical protein